MTDGGHSELERLLAETADGDVPTFEAPWQARAFGLAVALADREDRDWQAFHERFVARIDEVDPTAMQADVEGTYYAQWLESLEELLLEEGLVTEGELARRQRAFGEGDRDASEFVVED
ncbi:MAG: nitrile hydratase accessory protein [Haloferacaceae archaeon]